MNGLTVQSQRVLFALNAQGLSCSMRDKVYLAGSGEGMWSALPVVVCV